MHCGESFSRRKVLELSETAQHPDITDQLPRSAFAYEKIHSLDDDGAGIKGGGWGRDEFVSGVNLLFGEKQIDGESVVRQKRETEALRILQLAGAARNHNSPALLALLYAQDVDGKLGGGVHGVGAETPNHRGVIETPRMLDVLKECVRVTGGKEGGSQGEAVDGGDMTGHPLCHMSLGFRLWKGIGCQVDYGRALVHYQHAAQLAMRTLEPLGGQGGDVAGGGGRRSAGSARLVDYTEQARLMDEMLDDYRVVAAVQGVRGQLSLLQRGVRNVAGLDTGEGSAALDRLHAQAVMGHSRALPRNMAKGRLAAHLAAQLGSTRALLNEGVMALYGIGGTRDLSLAASAIKQAAARGDAWGKVALAGCSAYGGCGDIPVDLVKARELVHSAALADNAHALAVLGAVLRQGEWGYAKDFATARSLLDRAASLGDVSAVWHLGNMALGGEGIEPHGREAVRAFKHVAEKAVWFNMLQAAEVAYSTADFAGAYWRYALAAQTGSRVGLANMGYFLERGLPPLFDVNVSAAFRAYSLAAEQGDVPSQRRMGDMCYYGKGCTQDYPRSLELYLSNVHDAQSLLSAGWMYEMGLGSTRNVTKARELYMAAEHVGERRAHSVMQPLSSPFGHWPARLALWRLDLHVLLGWEGEVSHNTLERLHDSFEWLHQLAQRMHHPESFFQRTYTHLYSVHRSISSYLSTSALGWDEEGSSARHLLFRLWSRLGEELFDQGSNDVGWGSWGQGDELFKLMQTSGREVWERVAAVVPLPDALAPPPRSPVSRCSKDLIGGGGGETRGSQGAEGWGGGEWVLSGTEIAVGGMLSGLLFGLYLRQRVAGAGTRCVCVCVCVCVRVCVLRRARVCAYMCVKRVWLYAAKTHRLWHVPVYCSALQSVAVYCSVLQCIAVCRSALSCVTVCCRITPH